jgi:hypothetical protein
VYCFLATIAKPAHDGWPSGLHNSSTRLTSASAWHVWHCGTRIAQSQNMQMVTLIGHDDASSGETHAPQPLSRGHAHQPRTTVYALLPPAPMTHAQSHDHCTRAAYRREKTPKAAGGIVQLAALKPNRLPHSSEERKQRGGEEQRTKATTIKLRDSFPSGR